MINTINLGSLTVWSQLKNLPYYKLAAPTLATVIQGLDSVFLYAAYSEGLSAIFSSED